MSTTTDVATLAGKIYPRCQGIPTATFTSLLDVVREDIRQELIDTFPDNFFGQARYDFDKIGALTATLASPAAVGVIERGEYRYKVEFTKAEGGSMIGKASTVVTVSDNTVNGKVELTAIPVSSDSDVTARKIYRQQNGQGNYLLLTTISDNTTTTYTDNTTQASISTVGASGMSLPSDYYDVYALQNGTSSLEQVERSEDTSGTKDFFWIDFTNSTLNLHPEHNYTNLTFLYWKKIDDATDSGNLPYPAGLHARLLYVLAYGVCFNYMASRTGEDDHTSKLSELYMTAKANLFTGGIAKRRFMKSTNLS